MGVQAHPEVQPIGPAAHVVGAGQVPVHQRRCSSCQAPVSRVIAEADRPAPEPRNCSSAGTKSLDLKGPCRYSSGSTSVIFGLLRHHGGKIAEEKRLRSPVSGSVRLSFTRGTVTSTVPVTLISTSRGW